ncbi:hypothetical protein HDZ31DRAFT_46498 [Schizophyllum fasciatum]
MGPERPLWAYIADALLAHYVPVAEIPKDESLRMNTFLQTWSPYKPPKMVPGFIRALTSCAKKYRLRLECLAPCRDMIRAMPMWYHRFADARVRTLAAFSNASKCLRDKHKVRRVGDFEHLAAQRTAPDHELDNAECVCDACTYERETHGCEHPDDCYARAEAFLDTLPSKWDPRGEHAEDYEAENKPALDENLQGNWETFDWKITAHGHLGEAFRVFTSGEVQNERVHLDVTEGRGQPQLAATDGSCLHNGERNAQAGAGVYLEGLREEDQYSIRLPTNVEQSNQAGEMLAVMAAAIVTPLDHELRIETDSKWVIGHLMLYTIMMMDWVHPSIAFNVWRERSQPGKLRVS